MPQPLIVSFSSAYLRTERAIHWDAIVERTNLAKAHQLNVKSANRGSQPRLTQRGYLYRALAAIHGVQLIGVARMASQPRDARRQPREQFHQRTCMQGARNWLARG